MQDARRLANTSSREHSFTLCPSYTPLASRIELKILMFVFTALDGLPPPYLSEILVLRKQNRALRSSNQLLLDVEVKVQMLGRQDFFCCSTQTLEQASSSCIHTMTDPGFLKYNLEKHFF